jgi:hypothetical protein
LRRIYGDLHPQTLATRSNLGSIQLAAGNHAAAEQTFMDEVEILRTLFGDGAHPDLAFSLGMLAWSRLQRGATEQALASARQALSRIGTDDESRVSTAWIAPLNALIKMTLGQPADPELLGPFDRDCHELDSRTAMGRQICIARAWQAVEDAQTCGPGLPPNASAETLAALPADWQGIYRAVLQRCRPEQAVDSVLPQPPAWLNLATD